MYDIFESRNIFRKSTKGTLVTTILCNSARKIIHESINNDLALLL